MLIVSLKICNQDPIKDGYVWTINKETFTHGLHVDSNKIIVACRPGKSHPIDMNEWSITVN